MINPKYVAPRLVKEAQTEKKWVDRKKRVHEKRNLRKTKKSDRNSLHEKNLSSEGSIEIHSSSLEIKVGGELQPGVDDSRISMDDSRMGMNVQNESSAMKLKDKF